MTCSTLRRAWASPLLVAIMLSGCSGGGGGGGEGSGLSVSPSALAFTATRSGSTPAMQTIAATVTAPDATNIAVGFPAGTTVPSWLSLSVVSTSNPARLGVSVNTTALAYGSYRATVRVVIMRSDGSLIAYRDVPVTYEVGVGGFSPYPTSLAFTQVAGGAPPSPGHLYLAANNDTYAWSASVQYVDGAGWLTLGGGATASGTALPYTLDVAAAATAGMAAGTYDARIHLVTANRAVDVPVQLVVRPPHLALSRTAVALDAISGQAALPAAVTVDVGTEAGTVAYAASVAYGPEASGWLDVSGSGTAPETIAIAPNTTALSPGVATATVTLTPSNGAPPVDVGVTYALAIPQLGASPTTATFAAVAGQPSLPASASVGVTTQAGTIGYVTGIAYDATATGWLDVPAAGLAPEALALAPNTTLLPAGTHTATVTIDPLNGAAPVDVRVSYTLTASQLGLSPGNLAFSIDPTTQPAGLARALAVTDTGAQLEWTAESSLPWLSVSPSSGSTGTTTTVAVDASALESLPNGRHTATLTFTSNGPSVTNVRTTLTATIDVSLPLVRFVAPYVAYAGQAKEVILRGEGFASMAGPAIDFDGSAGSAVSVVSDTELRVTPPATLAQGRHLVKVTNGNQLGLVRSVAQLAIVPVRTHTAGLIASAGPRQRLVYDAERRCLYAADTAAGAVERWCDTGTAWASSTVNVAGVRDVALTPDGKQLLAISAAALHRIDAATFTYVETVTAAQLGIRLYTSDALQGIAVSNDGKALILAGYQWLSLYRWDPSGAAPATAVASSIDNGSAVAIAASLDGDRVVTGDGAGISSPVALLYDATGGTITRPSSSGVLLVTVDRSATRIGAYGSVYDGAFAKMPLAPGLFLNWRLAVSANGARAYVCEPGTTSKLATYDISGTTITQIGTAAPFPVDPGSANNATNLLLTSADGGTLFVDGTNGILVMPAP